MVTKSGTNSPIKKTRKSPKTPTGPRKPRANSTTRKLPKTALKGTQVKRHEMTAVTKIFIISCLILACSSFCYYFLIRPYAYRWKPCYGMKWYNVCMPCCYDVHGIDISHYQGDIEWDKLYTTRLSDYPIEFVFIKATEGTDYLDTAFQRNFRNAADYGLIRGAYHFFTPNTDPIKQAEFFIRTVKLDSGDLPPVLDVEVKGDNNKKEMTARVKLWLERIEKHYGVKPILYTSYKFKKKYLNDPFFDSYPYWIAHYYVDSVRYKGQWRFWQHTDIGTVPGIGEDVDLDVFNGSLEQLKELTIK